MYTHIIINITHPPPNSSPIFPSIHPSSHPFKNDLWTSPIDFDMVSVPPQVTIQLSMLHDRNCSPVRTHCSPVMESPPPPARRSTVPEVYGGGEVDEWKSSNYRMDDSTGGDFEGRLWTTVIKRSHQILPSSPTTRLEIGGPGCGSHDPPTPPPCFWAHHVLTPTISLFAFLLLLLFFIHLGCGLGFQIPLGACLMVRELTLRWDESRVWDIWMDGCEKKMVVPFKPWSIHL